MGCLVLPSGITKSLEQKKEITDEDTQVERNLTIGLWLHFKDNMNNFKALILFFCNASIVFLLYNNTFSYQADLFRVSVTSTSRFSHFDIVYSSIIFLPLLWYPSHSELYYP